MKTKFTSNLGRIAKQAPGLADAALKQTGEDIVSVIKQLAPVDTGDLRNSYLHEMVDTGVMRIGSSKNRGVYKRGYPTFYAPYVEFGTEEQSAQPHFIHGWRQVRPTFIVRFKQLLNRIDG